MIDPENRLHRLGLQALFGLLLLSMYVGAAFTVMRGTLPLPGAIATALLVQITEQGLLGAIRDGLVAILSGFFLAAVVGIPVGVFMGLSEPAEQFLDPYVNALYVLPYAALVPVFVVWFGTGLRVRLVITFLFALFPILINTYEGASTTPANLLEVAKSFGADREFVVLHVVLPHEMPYVLAGLRLGIGRAVKGLVVTEIIVSVSGIGAILSRWSAAYRLEGVISVVLALMALGVLLPWLLRVVHDRVVWWDHDAD